MSDDLVSHVYLMCTDGCRPINPWQSGLRRTQEADLFILSNERNVIIPCKCAVEAKRMRSGTSLRSSQGKVAEEAYDLAELSLG